MKILVIDNGTSYLTQLKSLVSGDDFQVVKYSKIGTVSPDNFDVIILSGGHDLSVTGNGERPQEEIDLVKNCKRPIFGICFGFQVIAHALGAKLEPLETKVRGILDIQVTEMDEIFLNIPNFQVFESHRWVVKEPTGEMLVLASSRHGIEIFRHKTKPIYGVQFHPEMFVEKSCGDEIFYNFLNSIK